MRHHCLRITDYGLPITDYRLRITVREAVTVRHYCLRITDYGLPFTDYPTPLPQYGSKTCQHKKEKTAMPLVNVRYIVNDVDRAIDFYTNI